MRQSPSAKLDPRLIERYSPRAFKSDTIPAEDIETLFEAARFAPSCRNEQPWLFVYATRQDDLARFHAALDEGNQRWATRAPLLIFAFAKRHFDHNGKPNRWAAFDLGAAWMSLSLQANQLGLHTHAMAGFDAEAAYAVTGVDAGQHEVICAIAVGYRDDPASLPEDLREREHPSPRKPQTEFVFEGGL